jgi:hypothetical protein
MGPLDWAQKLTERSQRLGSNINLAELFYTGDRDAAADYLASHGWRVDVQTTEQAYAAHGFELPNDELASFGDASATGRRPWRSTPMARGRPGRLQIRLHIGANRIGVKAFSADAAP